MIVEVVLWEGASRFWLHRAGFDTTIKRMTGRRPARWGHDTRAADVVRAGQHVHRVFGTGTCLAEAIAFAGVLTRHGRAPEVVVGSRRYDDGTWGAHAWVEVDGETHDRVSGAPHRAMAVYGAADAWLGRPA